jgi:hypothetical protein
MAMNAEELHKQQLEENSLAKGLTTLAKKAKSGSLVSPKVLAVILAVALVGGLWWYFSSTNKKADSLRWSEYELARSEEAFKKLADDNPKTNVAPVARLAAARLRLTNEGLAKLNIPKDRADAIEAVAKSRDELKQLAGDFEKAGDRLLRVECLRLSAQAELALVGVPKPGVAPLDQMNPANQRGTVAAAIELLNTAAKAIGENTPAGERFKKQSGELTAANNRKDNSDAMAPLAFGKYINDLLVYVPETKVEPKAPEKPLDPIPAPTPPEGATPSTRGTRR